MVDVSKPEEDIPTADSPGSARPTPPSASARRTRATKLTSQSVRVEGLAETLSRVRHELDLISHASKFDWVSKRLILLRNAVIAFSVLTAVIIFISLTVREAYKETLSIAAFSVPEKLGERGITGQVVAQSLFDELIKRRTTVTTLEAGELKSAWSEHRSDVAVPETKFTLQAIFRYLRTLTGKEIAIDGEMLVDGDNVAIKARVAGKPPRSVKGKLADWETLMGELANYVYEVTQPVVLASYWGLTAKTSDEVDALARLIRRMENATPRTSPAVLSVAYHGLGLALQRQERETDALAAWARARVLDPKFSLPYTAAADALFAVNEASADEILRQASKLQMSTTAQFGAASRRFSVGHNLGDCRRMKSSLDELAKLSDETDSTFELSKARFMVQCDYRQAKGVALLREHTRMHADHAFRWTVLGFAEESRKLRLTHRADAIAAYTEGVAHGRADRFYYPHFHLARQLSDAGDHAAALAAFDRGVKISRGDVQLVGRTRGVLYANNGEYREAEALFRELLSPSASSRAYVFTNFANYVLARTNRVDEAIATLRAGYARYPQYCPAYDDAGTILFKAGRDADAFAEWEKGIAAVPKCDLTYVHIAQALIERKRIPEAKQKLDALLKVSPESDGAEIAKELLGNMAKAG